MEIQAFELHINLTLEAPLGSGWLWAPKPSFFRSICILRHHWDDALKYELLQPVILLHVYVLHSPINSLAAAVEAGEGASEVPG